MWQNENKKTTILISIKSNTGVPLIVSVKKSLINVLDQNHLVFSQLVIMMVLSLLCF